MENKKTALNSAQKEISSAQLVALLKAPTDEILQKNDGTSEIVFEDYIVKDECLILDDIEIFMPLTFKNCSFDGKYFLSINNVICNESVTFDGCDFSKGVHFHNESVFKKELCFKYVRPKSIHLSGSFQKISISGYDIKKIFVSGAAFESLYIGEHIINTDIDKLSIFTTSKETGNIIVKGQIIKELFLSGTNEDSKLEFDNIKCDSVDINDFTNKGSLNFYGLKPIDLNSDKRYFQIINSNLENAQFFRTYFSHYKELIIIDSFITSVTFIACQWSNNVRALHGPGTVIFDESIKTGRKIAKDEVYAIKEAYRQLKISMSKHSDKIQESKFYAEELSFHNKTLDWSTPCKNEFWDKLILGWSKYFSDYGQSFIRPLFWLLAGHLILFVLVLIFGGFAPLHLTSPCNATSEGFKVAFEKYFTYINPLRRVDTSLSGYFIIFDLGMRIWASYMIYNLIRASRRFIS
ncbi:MULTISPECIES: hypothetical protein [Chitinophagaceae]